MAVLLGLACLPHHNVWAVRQKPCHTCLPFLLLVKETRRQKLSQDGVAAKMCSNLFQPSLLLVCYRTFINNSVIVVYCLKSFITSHHIFEIWVNGPIFNKGFIKDCDETRFDLYFKKMLRGIANTFLVKLWLKRNWRIKRVTWMDTVLSPIRSILVHCLQYLISSYRKATLNLFDVYSARRQFSHS